MNEAAVERLKSRIRDVPDFPRPGIIFKDITPLLADASTLNSAADLLAAYGRELRAEGVVAVEARGFILGSLVADRLSVGFVPVRKPGKLPYKTQRATYQLEYGEDALEIHEDALTAGTRALVVDDVLATGGTARATGELIERIGGVVAGYAFLIELAFLGGRSRLAGAEIRSLIRY
jgi:adenine phosphoribosyltransferase